MFKKWETQLVGTLMGVAQRRKVAVGGESGSVGPVAGLGAGGIVRVPQPQYHWHLYHVILLWVLSHAP